MHLTRAITVCLFALAAVAQAQAKKEPSFCFRGRPLPTCGAFLILEPGASGQVVRAGGIPIASPSNSKDPNGFVTIDLGAMVNRPDRSAIGATAELGVGQRSSRRLALELRRRQWLSDRIAFDLGAGPVEINGRESFVPLQPGAGYGATAHAGLVLMDLATVTTSVDLVQGRRTQLSLSLGGRLGSYAGVATTLVLTGLGALVGAALRD